MTGAVTVAVAEIGAFPGRGRAHPRVVEEVSRRIRQREGTPLAGSFVARCGGSVVIVAAHGPSDHPQVRLLLGDALEAGRAVGLNRGLDGCGDRTAASFATIEGTGANTGILVFVTDRAGPGIWTPLLCRLFADPFETPRLADDPVLREGFVFELTGSPTERFQTPGGILSLLAALRDGTGRRVARVLTPGSGKTVAAVSDPGPGGSILVGTTGDARLPFTGEWLRAAMTPCADEGTILFPVAVCDAGGGAGDGLSRCCCLGFQLTPGRLVGPADLFDDPAFDLARQGCLGLLRPQRLLNPLSAPTRT